EMGDPIQIQLKGTDHKVLTELADQIVTNISKVKGVYNPESAASEGVPQMTIELDEDKAAEYGLMEEQITNQIQLQFTGQLATQRREEGEEMDVTLLYP